MKSILVIIGLGFCCNLVLSQTSNPVCLNNTEQFVLESKFIPDQNFTIQVCLPVNYNKEKQYPVVYLLDADKSIGMAKEIADWLMFSKEIMDIIIVGIAYNKDDKTWWINRSRDFSPTLDTITDFGKNWPKSGGADNFLDFMEHKLMPEIKERYASDPKKNGIVGFSFGGLLGSYVLFTRPYLFKNYLIISPALGWDQFIIKKFEKEFYNKNQKLNKSVFMVISSEDPKGMVKDPTNRFVEIVKNRNYNGLELEYEIFPEETHMSGYGRGITTGFKSLYKP